MCCLIPGRRGLQANAAVRNVWRPWGLFGVSSNVFDWEQIKGINSRRLKGVENEKRKCPLLEGGKLEVGSNSEGERCSEKTN